MTEQAFHTPKPELEDVLRLAFSSLSADLRVCMPGRIESYDARKQQAHVLPLLQRRSLVTGVAESLPVIPNVPIIHPRTAGAWLHLPIAKGDYVLLVFADREISTWMNGNGEETLPASLRKHDLSDAFAIPGAWPSKSPMKPLDPKALELRAPKIAIGNGTEELIDLFHQLLSYLENDITFSNGGGPTGKPTNFDTVTEIRTKLEAMKV